MERLRWLTWLELARTGASKTANQLNLKAYYCFCPMAKLNFLKNKASNTWPWIGTMHVDLPQGLENVTHRLKSQEEVP